MGNAPPHGSSRDPHHGGVMDNQQNQHGPYNQKQQQQNQQQHVQNQQPYGGGGGSRQQYHTQKYNSNSNNNQMNYRMQASTSDASMSNVDDSHYRSSSMPSVPLSSSKQNLQPLDLASLTTAEDDTVPTVFRWEHGGRQVYITGTFNGWSRQIPMHRSGNDFTYIHNLQRGKHAFKFIVDDEWRFAPDQPTVADIEGRINNFIDVTDFKPYTGDREFEREKNAAYYSQSRTVTSANDGGANGADSSDGGNGMIGSNQTVQPDGSSVMDTFVDPDGEVFTHHIPDVDEYTKDPPPLPPHLRHIILNKPPQLTDTAALPVPQHVALNHLYCTAIKDNMMVLGITQRFKTKFVTTVYYSPELSK